MWAAEFSKNSSPEPARARIDPAANGTEDSDFRDGNTVDVEDPLEQLDGPLSVVLDQPHIITRHWIGILAISLLDLDELLQIL